MDADNMTTVEELRVKHELLEKFRVMIMEVFEDPKSTANAGDALWAVDKKLGKLWEETFPDFKLTSSDEDPFTTPAEQWKRYLESKLA